MIADMGRWSDKVWSLNLRINEDMLCHGGRQQMFDLETTLQDVSLRQNESDTFVWWRDPKGLM